MRKILSLVFIFSALLASAQIEFQSFSSSVFVTNVLRYDVEVETNESVMGYVEWNRLDSENNVVESYHSNLEGPSVLLAFQLIGFVQNTVYQWRVVAWNDFNCATSDWQLLTTGMLPPDVGTITNVYTTTPGLQGYYMTNTVSTPDKTLQMFNRQGEVVWYDWHAGADGVGIQQNCEMWDITDDGNTLTLECHRMEERDLLGNIIAAVDFTGTPYEEFFFHHDVIKNVAGNYVAIAAEVRLYDFSSIGGVVDQQVIGEGLMEFDELGNMIWEWWSLDYFDPVALNASNQNAFFTPLFGASAINWQHCNAVKQDYDGNYLISFKERNQLYKIDYNTGDIIWSISGNNPTIPLQNDAGFAEQHDINRQNLEDEKYMVFDNLGDGVHSRLVEFSISYYEEPTAYKTWEYIIDDSIASGILGSARKLLNGNRFGVCGAPGALPANKGHIIEVTEDGEVVWHAKQSSWVYRAYYYDELWQEQDVNLDLEPIVACTGQSQVLNTTDTPIYFFGDNVTDGEFFTWGPGNYQVYYKYGWITDTLFITVPAPVLANLQTNDALCADECNGSASVTIPNGTIDWGELEPNDLCPGPYQVSVTDENGCTIAYDFEISEPDTLNCPVEVINVTNGGDGELCVEAEGGTQDYSIDWDSGQDDLCIDELEEGTYAFTLTDANGCICVGEAEVNVAVSEMENKFGIQLYPNPTEDEVRLSGDFATFGLKKIEVIDFTGKMVMEDTSPPMSHPAINLSGLVAGHYTLRITGLNDTQIELRVVKQ
ncbi:MAG: aryl-sulfate sulfotransferase [Flavobacteriales bacterium]|nr:aryl-sulfate sulfotransferase [Flavobacteriales bacterium]